MFKGVGWWVEFLFTVEKYGMSLHEAAVFRIRNWLS